MSLLSIRDLSLDINGAAILDNVSLEVGAGEIFGLIGESGSGKSITALAAMRLLPRGANLSGTISFDGRNLGALSEDDMCALRGNSLSMVFQEPMTALNPVKTIGAQVVESLTIHGTPLTEARRIATETLTRVGLPPSSVPSTRYPHQLSGGQRQRVVIAIAIACRPKVLIADEPTTALDVTTEAEIVKLLRDLVQEEQMGLIFITHDLPLISGLADRIAVLRHGAVVETGATLEVFQNLEHPYTRALAKASVHAPVRHSHISEEVVLDVDGLLCTYSGRRQNVFARRETTVAVNNVSLRLHRGEHLGIVGESGCGKSTLARAVLGLQPIASGRITVLGTAIDANTRMPNAVRRNLQVVFQDPYGSFNPRHRVDRLISEPLHLHDETRGHKRERVEELLVSVGLSANDADKYIHEFSGGQRQRIAIARALIIDPDIVVLDEAVSALDVSVRAQILDLLGELAERRNLSMIFISHDLSVVRAIADRVCVMRHGNIVEEGETEDVFRHPKDTYTRGLISAAPSWKGLDPSKIDM